MAFRNVIISNRCKLSYSLNYLVCRKENETIRILLDEIRLLFIESCEVSITTSLIAMLSEKKIKVIFCDEFHNPICETVSYQNNYYSYRKIKEQLVFVKNGDLIWKYIIHEKIINQANNLRFLNKEEANLLEDYSNEILSGDSTNREGHSAKVYFNSLFGKSFNRNQDNHINIFLNYGYSILLSTINREIKMLGYLTELGIHHIGESNPFNFSCDLIEPLRPLVDLMIIKNVVNIENYKIEFINMLSRNVIYNNQQMILDNAIHLYIQNVIECLKNNNFEELKFIKYEL